MSVFRNSSKEREKILLVVDKMWGIKEQRIVLGSMKKAILFIPAVFEKKKKTKKKKKKR